MLDKLSNIVQETVKDLNVHISTFPTYSWIASISVNQMVMSGLDLRIVTDEARCGRIATGPLARLTDLKQ